MANRSNSVESSAESFFEYEYDFDVDVVVDELSSWELIDLPSDDDSEDLDSFSFTEENLTDDTVSGSKQEDSDEHDSPFPDIYIQSLLIELQPPNFDDIFEQSPSLDKVYEDQEEENEEYDDEHDYDDYDGYDLDDELVPLQVSGKLGRQRIRKLGKRACPRMNKSKRLPYYYNMPGCVRGKHGLGVQHAYI